METNFDEYIILSCFALLFIFNVNAVIRYLVGASRVNKILVINNAFQFLFLGSLYFTLYLSNSLVYGCLSILSLICFLYSNTEFLKKQYFMFSKSSTAYYLLRCVSIFPLIFFSIFIFDVLLPSPKKIVSTVLLAFYSIVLLVGVKETDKKEKRTLRSLELGVIYFLTTSLLFFAVNFLEFKNYGIPIFFVLHCFIAVVIYFENYVSKEKINHLEVQEIIELDQIKTHFMFNALNSVQNYLLKEETDEAIKYLDNYTTVIRKHLEHTHTNWITLEDEISFLNAYLKVEQLLHQNFEFAICVPEHLKPEQVKIPGLIIQPYIENAVKHGLANKEDGQISIQFKKEGAYLQCFISDLGTGNRKVFTSSSNCKKISLGIKLALNRLEHFSCIPSEKLVDCKNEKYGRDVTIKLPFKMSEVEVDVF